MPAAKKDGATDRTVPIQVTANLHESAKGDKPPKAAAYAFTSNGRYLTSAEITEQGSATLQVPPGQTAQDVRVVVGPWLQEKEVKFAELTRRGAQERFVRVGPEAKELRAHFEIPSEAWFCWFRLCFVKGTLLKRIFSSGVAIDYPVCAASLYQIDLRGRRPMAAAISPIAGAVESFPVKSARRTTSSTATTGKTSPILPPLATPGGVLSIPALRLG